MFDSVGSNLEIFHEAKMPTPVIIVSADPSGKTVAFGANKIVKFPLESRPNRNIVVSIVCKWLLRRAYSTRKIKLRKQFTFIVFRSTIRYIIIF